MADRTVDQLKAHIESNVLIDDRGCWIWQLAKKFGYGRIVWQKRKWQVHRLSYTIYLGEIPGKLLACHTCDNPACVNPNHIFLGTHGDNSRDMVSKGRNLKRPSDWRPQAKLTVAQVQELMILRGTDTCKNLAKRYSVAADTVEDIFSGRTWSRVTGVDRK